MKTAISIPDDLFEDIDKLSKKLHCSRSKIIANASREYIDKLKNKKILDSINKVYSEKETANEVNLRNKSKKYYSKLLKDERW